MTIFKMKDSPDIALLRRIFICILFLVISLISAAFDPIDFTFHIIGVISSYQGLIFALFITKQISTNKYQSIWKDNIYIILSLGCLVVALLNIFRGINFGSFFRNEPPNSGSIYYITYIFQYLLYGIIMYMIMQLHINDIKSKKNAYITYKIRRSLSMFAFTLGLFDMIIVEINILLVLIGFSNQRYLMNDIHQLLRSLIHF